MAQLNVTLMTQRGAGQVEGCQNSSIGTLGEE